MGTRANQEMVETWLKEGKEKGATHCLIICDTWDLADGFEDYPLYVYEGEDVENEKKLYQDSSGIERLLHCYELSKDIETLLEIPYKPRYSERAYKSVEGRVICP